jgi:hypothetical protein
LGVSRPTPIYPKRRRNANLPSPGGLANALNVQLITEPGDGEEAIMKFSARRESDMSPTSVSRGSNRLKRGLVAIAVAVVLPAAAATSPAAAVATSTEPVAADPAEPPVEGCITIVTSDGTIIIICT